MEREISSSAGRQYRLWLPILWFGVMLPAGGFHLWHTTRAGEWGFFVLLIFVFGAFSVGVLSAARQPSRVTLTPSYLRIEQSGRIREIPLSKVRYAELEPPGRGPRRISVFVMPEPGAGDPALEQITFVPTQGEFFGGRQVLEELERHIAVAKGTPPIVS